MNQVLYLEKTVWCGLFEIGAETVQHARAWGHHTAVKRDGKDVPPRTLMNSYAENTNLENPKLENTALVCDLECTFGELEGEYALAFEAVRYAPKVGMVSGRYARRSSECPAVLTGSTELGFALEPKRQVARVFPVKMRQHRPAHVF